MHPVKSENSSPPISATESPSLNLTNLTPMMAQYWSIKQDYEDCLLLYRMGDFYELFFDDAVKASQALDIALTKRGKHQDQDIPMCGIPAHASESYIARLIKQGYRVALCNQLEDPSEAKKRGYKALVKRDVVRVITPGTLTEDSLLNAKSHNFIAAVAYSGKTLKDSLSIAYLDLSTGDFFLESLDTNDLINTLARIEPAELLLPDVLMASWYDKLKSLECALTPLPLTRFHMENAVRQLENTFQVKTLESFGEFSETEVLAGGALIDYVSLTQKSTLWHVHYPRKITASSYMVIDASTRKNLELTRTLKGAYEGSLLHTLDLTLTAAGGRLLVQYLSSPLLNKNKLEARLNAVQYLFEESSFRHRLRTLLKNCADLERALARLYADRGGPRDLAIIKGGIITASEIADLIKDLDVPPLLHKISEQCGYHGPLIDRLNRSLADSLPIHARDGGFIAPGYLDALDELKGLRDHSQAAIVALQEKYISETGVNTLKIRFNNIIGYHIEVGPSHADKIPPTFVHRQSLASALRYTTGELLELEQKISSAAEKATALEIEVYKALVSEVKAQCEAITKAAHAIAAVDCLASLAEIAHTQGYIRPTLDESTAFVVHEGRHPVVEKHLKTLNQHFTANDCKLQESNRLWLLTGPNMAGKSTYLRQNALIAIMAQIGSFVPAGMAHIGIVDRVFSRVGASDDLAKGQSTFMVEMVETATILNQATPRSLVILDEIGRGTATFDGLAIAWAVVEYLHNHNQSRALFATHYHELTELSQILKAVSVHQMKVKEHQGEIIFMHEVGVGAAERSYGIHVARLAGVPRLVIARATQILESLEAQKHGKGIITTPPPPLPLFEQKKPNKLDALEKELHSIDPHSLSPREALDLIYKWQGLLGQQSDH